MAYTRVLRAYYRREKPLADHAEACRLCRAVTRSQKAAVQAVLSEFFTLEADGWHNKRADEEISAYQAQASTNRRIAQSRICKRIVNEPSNEPCNESSTKRTPNQEPLTTNQEPEKNKGSRFALPDWVPADAWDEWVKARKNKPTAEAKRLSVLDLEKLRADGHDPRAVLEQSIKRGWTGLFPIKDADAQKPAAAPWWTSDASIQAKGRELGMTPNPGETWQNFRGRINERLGAK